MTYVWRGQLFCGELSPQRLRGCSSQNSAFPVSFDTKINWIQKYNRYKTVSYDTENTMQHPCKPFLLMRIIMFRLTRYRYHAIVSLKSWEPWLRKNCTSGFARTQAFYKKHSYLLTARSYVPQNQLQKIVLGDRARRFISPRIYLSTDTWRFKFQ